MFSSTDGRKLWEADKSFQRRKQLQSFHSGEISHLPGSQTHVKPPKDFPSRSRAAQRDQSCGCPIAGSVQSRTGQGFRQPNLVEGVPACSRGVGPDDCEHFNPNHFVILWSLWLNFFGAGSPYVHVWYKSLVSDPLSCPLDCEEKQTTCVGGMLQGVLA